MVNLLTDNSLKYSRQTAQIGDTLFVFYKNTKIFLSGSRASPCFVIFLNLRIFEAYFKNISSLSNFLNILNFHFRIFRLSPLKILNI